MPEDEVISSGDFFGWIPAEWQFLVSCFWFFVLRNEDDIIGMKNHKRKTINQKPSRGGVRKYTTIIPLPDQVQFLDQFFPLHTMVYVLSPFTNPLPLLPL
ncbi:MAG: hypothetical protein V1926_04760 [Candidatus Peregrinibacteria bacterium]